MLHLSGLFLQVLKVPEFDYLNKVSKPFQLLQGGYIGYNDGDGWHQLFAQLPNADKMALLRPDTPAMEGGMSKFNEGLI